MNIGILGGSFDPIHNGHIHMARCSMEEYALDEVWLMPAGHSPNKEESLMTPAVHRTNMCELACKNEPRIKTCALEVDAPETSYTYRTLEKLSERFPNDRFYFIMGADSLSYFTSWVNPQRICALAVILVVNRGEYKLSELESMAENIRSLFWSDIRFVHCKKDSVSSRRIRRMLQLQQSVDPYLPPDVIDYIKTNQLYR